MNIVYMHMHLKPGGVTTVISQQATALIDDCGVLVMTGDDPPENFPAPHVRIDGLGYDDPDSPENDPNPHDTAAAVESAIYARWPDGCDIIHVHNPLLAKNSRLLAILEQLKTAGFTLFLQIHDFPEDGRYWSYHKNRQYPGDCHYGTINTRDRRILIQSGLNPDGVHTLFNMVNPIDISDLEEDAPPTVLYPIRGIRRKNIGEALLLSLYFPENTPLAITLPPNSPIDWQFYNNWKRFAKEAALNVLFEASAYYDFSALVAASRYLISTSITEGFGFAFLEPWTAGKALMGRKLPDICIDFEARGVNLHHLYGKLLVPLSWIDHKDFEMQWKQCIRKTFARYGARIDAATMSEGFACITENDLTDFSMLNEPLQRQVINRLINNVSDYREFERINPVLTQFRMPPAFNRVIEQNRKALSKWYSRSEYRNRLLDIYKTILNRPVRHAIAKDDLLKAFLRPENFSLMKWCDNDLQ